MNNCSNICFCIHTKESAYFSLNVNFPALNLDISSFENSADPYQLVSRRQIIMFYTLFNSTCKYMSITKNM